jgi:hypothetical protein
MIKDLQVIAVSATAITDPEVPSGTFIILVGRGRVTVGRLDYALSDPFSISIEHPRNEERLSNEAELLVKAHCPEKVNDEHDWILFCPASIGERMRW